jgi:hypothetical protein
MLDRLLAESLVAAEGATAAAPVAMNAVRDLRESSLVAAPMIFVCQSAL